MNRNCSFIGRQWDLKYDDIENLIDTHCPNSEFCPEMGYESINDYPKNDGVYFVPTGDDNPHCRMFFQDKIKL